MTDSTLNLLEHPPTPGAGSDKTCRTCTYWERSPLRSGSGYLGICRRSPPSIVVTGGQAKTHWPQTVEDDWCGRWMPAAVLR